MSLPQSPFVRANTAEQVTEGLDLSGQTVLVTGCNSGLGLETTRVLALRGAHIIGLARSVAKAQGAFDSLGIDGTPVACDLADIASVRAAVQTVGETGRALDVIVANAGIMALPERQTMHGIELQFFTNHVGHFALITGLLDQLAPAGRVVVLSSGAHHMAPAEGIRLDDLGAEAEYSPWTAYGQSKLANVLFVRSLAARFAAAGSAQTTNAVHPGVVHTNLARHIPDKEALFSQFAGQDKQVDQGASTQCFVASHPSLAAVSGLYFADNALKGTSEAGKDDALAEKLWTATEHILSGI